MANSEDALQVVREGVVLLTNRNGILPPWHRCKDDCDHPRILRRLAGFAKLDMVLGEARQIEVPLEWRVIADWGANG